MAGVKLVEESGRKYLRRVIERHKLDRENQGAMEAREQAELVGREFLMESGKTFIDEVTKDDVYRFHRALRDRRCAPRTFTPCTKPLPSAAAAAKRAKHTRGFPSLTEPSDRNDS